MTGPKPLTPTRRQALRDTIAQKRRKYPDLEQWEVDEWLASDHGVEGGEASLSPGMGPVSAFGVAAGQSILPVMDEIVAGLRPGPYRENIGPVRAEFARARREHPIASGVGTVAGTVVPVGAGLGMGKRIGQQVLRGGALGLGYGAATGIAGSEEEGLGRVTDAIAPGVVGGGIGAVAPPLFWAGGKLGHAIGLLSGRKGSVKTDVTGELRDVMAETGEVAAKQMNRFRKGGVSEDLLTPADLNPTLRAELGGAMLSDPKAPLTAEFFAQRAAERPTRLSDLLVRHLPVGPGSPIEVEAALAQETAELGRRVFGALPPLGRLKKDHPLRQFLGRDIVEQAFERVKSLEELAQGRKRQFPTLENFQRVRDVLHTGRITALRSGDLAKARDFAQAREQLTDLLTRQIPEYAVANRQYAMSIAQEEAVALGRGATKLSPTDMAEEIRLLRRKAGDRADEASARVEQTLGFNVQERLRMKAAEGMGKAEDAAFRPGPVVGRTVDVLAEVNPERAAEVADAIRNWDKAESALRKTENWVLQASEHPQRPVTGVIPTIKSMLATATGTAYRGAAGAAAEMIRGEGLAGASLLTPKIAAEISQQLGQTGSRRALLEAIRELELREARHRMMRNVATTGLSQAGARLAEPNY